MPHSDTSAIVIDVDNTITIEDSALPYSEKKPNTAVIEKLKEYRSRGFRIVLFSARSMRTYNGKVDQIIEHTVPILVEWLKRHDVPFDELIVGKPWCGPKGFYVDDRTVRPSEFVSLSIDSIYALMDRASD